MFHADGFMVLWGFHTESLTIIIAQPRGSFAKLSLEILPRLNCISMIIGSVHLSLISCPFFSECNIENSYADPQ